MSPAGRVSVIMPFLDAERFIRDSIESVIAQSYGRWELLLVDDGSRDGSSAIAHRYAEQYSDRIRHLEHHEHATRGASASRNLGIRHARGEYLAFLDADDLWLPRKLEDQVPLLDAHPEAGALYGNTLYWYSWTGVPEDRARDYMPALGVPRNTILQPPTLLLRLLRGRAAVPCTCSLVIRRPIVERIGGWEDQFRRVFTDQAFYVKLLLAAPVYVAERCWDLYRRHPDSCCAVAEAAGELSARRLAYLRWVGSYFAEQGVQHAGLWRELRRELWMQRHPTAHRTWKLARRLKRRLASKAARLARDAGASWPMPRAGLKNRSGERH